MTYPPSRPSRPLVLSLLLLIGLCSTVPPASAVADDLALQAPFIDELDETTGSISGSVTDEATGEPLAAQVTVWSESGSLVASLDAVGDYDVELLASGRYYVKAVPTPPNAEHLAELYDDVPCPHGVCDLAAGTLVTVDPATETTEVDFALIRGGSLTGRVTNIFGLPLAISVLIWDEEERLVARTDTDSDGRFLFRGLATGGYYVSTSSPSFQYYDLVYPHFPCSPIHGCDPLDGSLIPVAVGETTSGIDFVLVPLMPCTGSTTTICLDGRFSVEVEWSDFEHDGGAASVRPFTSNAAFFYFFSPDNAEVVVKILRACFGPTPRYWFFAGGLTNLEVVMTVTDTATGQSAQYYNPLGTAFELIRDTGTFMSCEPVPATAALTAEPLARTEPDASPFLLPLEKEGACTPDSTTLCLNDRFEVTATWTSSSSPPRAARAVVINRASGHFWFFEQENAEIVVKVIDACGYAPFFNHWVFATGLTDLGVVLRVRDTVSGEERVYTNDLGEPFVPVQDTSHFGACP